MLYVGYLIVMNGQNIKKIGFENFENFELLRVENCISRLCPSPLPPSKHPNRVKST